MGRADVIRRGLNEGTSTVTLVPTPSNGVPQDGFKAGLRDELEDDFGERRRRARARYYLAATTDLPDGFARGWRVAHDGDSFVVMSVDNSALGLARIDVKKA